MKIKIKPLNKKSIVIWLPYFILHSGGWLVTSKLLWKFIHSSFIKERIDEGTSEWIPASVDRKDVQELMRTLKMYRGLTLVEVISEDGTEVVVRL